jgi:hypothetical protein
VDSPIVVDDDGSVETEANTSEGSDDDVQFIGENLDPPNVDPDQIHEVDDDGDDTEATTDNAAGQEDEIEADETPETDEEEASVNETTDEMGEELGRGCRIKKKPKRLIEDENYRGRKLAKEAKTTLVSMRK